jgi:hypothetical protein
MERSHDAVLQNGPRSPNLGRRHFIDVRLDKLFVDWLWLLHLQDKQPDGRNRDDRCPEKDQTLAHSPTLRAPRGGVVQSLERRQMPQRGHLDPLPALTLKLIAGLVRRHRKPAATVAGQEISGHEELWFGGNLHHGGA